MKLTSLTLMVVLFLQVKPTEFTRFTYVKKNVELSVVFTEIRKQTGYYLLWNEKEINAKRKISVDFKNADIKDVINALSNKLNYSYSIRGKHIVLVKENRFEN